MGCCLSRDSKQAKEQDVLPVEGLSLEQIDREYCRLEVTGAYHIQSGDSDVTMASILANYRLLNAVNASQNIQRSRSPANASPN